MRRSSILFDGLPIANALFALVLDVLVLVALWAKWLPNVLGT